MDKEAQEKIAIRLHSTERSLLRVINEVSPCNCMWDELAEEWKKHYRQNADWFLRDIMRLGYCKPLDRPELMEKIRKIVINLATGVLIICHPVGELGDEDKARFDELCQLIYDQILSFYPDIPEGKPPLLRQENCHEVNNPSDWNMGAEAQREADIKWYRGEK